ncbi:hypothetical protein HMPREF1553_01286 [Porphyromonas gingivalis F0568]|nr:hypothetical protein HMPREF1553_01286 [Porphyromonas gingivalis F0568]
MICDYIKRISSYYYGQYLISQSRIISTFAKMLCIKIFGQW